jgi:hypothetical protein
MKRIIFLAVMLALSSPAFAGEKEDLQKDITILQLQKQNIELQMIILPETHGKIEKALKDAIVRLKNLEDKKQGELK